MGRETTERLAFLYWSGFSSRSSTCRASQSWRSNQLRTALLRCYGQPLSQCLALRLDFFSVYRARLGRQVQGWLPNPPARTMTPKRDPLPVSHDLRTGKL